MAQQTNLSKQRLDQINSLKKAIESLTQYFNDSFTGSASIQRQNSSIENILGLVSTIQGSALQVRELNSKLVLQHQVTSKMNQVRMLEASYQQLSQAMNSMQNVMALDDSPTGLVDNSDFPGPIGNLSSSASDSNDQSRDASADGDSKNFSQPGFDPAANLVSDDVPTESVAPLSTQMSNSGRPASDVDDSTSAFQVRDDDKSTFETRSQAEPAKTQAPLESSAAQVASPAKEDSQPKSQRGGFTRFHRGSQNEQSKTTVQDQGIPSSNGAQSSQAEYERHRQDALANPERIKRRLEQVNAEEKAQTSSRRQSGFGIRWAGTKHFINRDGSIVDDSVEEERAIRDVTPKKSEDEKASSDQDAIDSMINNELDKLN